MSLILFKSTLLYSLNIIVIFSLKKKYFRTVKNIKEGKGQHNSQA
jgi:hypothetical protein